MTIKLPETDVVVVGLGWTGSIIARELTRAGLNVIALERGRDQVPVDDVTLPGIRDELRYAVRMETMWNLSTNTLTFRNDSTQMALPMRKLGAFLPGEGVGGSGVHWGGLHWRFLPSDLRLRSHITETCGAGFIPDDMTLQDFPVSYAELEPFYTHFDKICAVSGKAGNLRGRTVGGGNPFEGPRSEDYPNPPLTPTLAQTMFTQASHALGYHPFALPAANASAPYRNPEGITVGACQYCGFCNRLGCESNAKASPNVCIMPALRNEAKFTLRSHAFVEKIVYDQSARKARGVIFTDLRNGQQYEQPARIVILAGYVFTNVQLMLLSGIGTPYDPVTGKGHVGRNYCYQVEASVRAFFPGKEFNPFMAAAGSLAAIDDYNSGRIDNRALGFIGGGFINGGSNGLPIQGRTLPPGSPRWGSEWKRETAQWYRSAMRLGCDGAGHPSRGNYLDLDPTYKDALGRPLLRMTYTDTAIDLKQSDFLVSVAEKISHQMGASVVAPSKKLRRFSIVPYQSTHNAGGTVMGATPADSVVNRYLQSWDADNLFVMGASVFPHQPSYNPTGTIGALAYWSARAIISRYLKSEGPLVDA